MEKCLKKVSIIVPAYNVEDYIEKCIDSLLTQTYRNIEIIIVDDGSTDRTGKIVEEKYNNNSKVVIYHKKNGGLSDARNYGLDRMTGDYVTFVDSDDYVDKEFIFYLLKIIGDAADIAVIPHQTFRSYESINFDYDFKYEIVSTEIAVKKMLLRDKITHTSCGKLFKAFVWKELRFPYRKLYEDYYTTFDAFAMADNVAIGNAAMYFYYQRETSIMHLKCNKQTVGIIDATLEVSPKIKKYWPDLFEEVVDLQVALCLKCLQNIYSNGKNNFLEEQRKIKNIINNNARTLIFSPKVGYKDKIKVLMSYLPADVFLKIYNKYDGNRERNN